ncbi:MAG: hypothetical protein ABJH05_18015 [Fulvivirga sp.]
MKKLGLLLYFMLSCFMLSAHEGNKHEKRTKEDSTHLEQSQENSSQIQAQQEHEQDEHESKKVTADLDDFPNLHPLMVHFPIVLLLIGAVLAIANVVFLKKEIDWVITGMVS